MGDYKIRTLRQDEMDFVIELAEAEGWNPGLYDADCFYHTDPNGFLVGLLDGRAIGCISAVSYGGGFGFVGLYIVAPEYRGQGYGIQLWQKAIQKLNGHNIGLDGVVAQQPNYLQSGFKLAYRNIRYESVATSANVITSILVNLCDVNFDSLCAYDRAFFPVHRNCFLKHWIAMPESIGFAQMENDQIRGYGLIRRCRRGYKIGPLCADAPEIGESLFTGLTAQIPAGSPLFLDVPEVNPLAVELAHRHQMRKVFETARMYTQTAPPIQMDGLFGVTTFELG